MTRQEILKNAKPILFNTDMVRAILDGRKTVTRRAIKGELKIDEDSEIPMYYPEKGRMLKGRRYEGVGYQGGIEHFIEEEAPYHPGDILYVRETFHMDDSCILYKAENPKLSGYRNINGEDIVVKWRPSIHMPKEAARIFLKVTNVRVERLKDMTDKDALKEGAQGVKCDHAGLGAYGCTDCMNTGWLEPPMLEFMEIWNSTIKKSDLDCYGWDANPWVWVIEFEMINIDE